MTESSPALALKSALARRENLLVVNIDYSNGSLVEFLAANGADVIFIDCEQGDTSIESIPDLARAAHIAGTAAIVRIASFDPADIERHMFRGVDGIVIPRLERVEQVRDVVAAVRYCFPNGYEEKTIIIQIETAEAARDIDDILAVDGVDALFIGPVDLAKSMGHPGNPGAPEVVAEIDRVIERVTGAGKPVGILVHRDSIADWAAKGVSFLYLHTNDFLRAGVEPFAAVKKKFSR